MTRRTYSSPVEGFAREVGSAGPVAVVGNRTAWSRGGEVDAGTHLVHAPSGIVAHAPEDMTVRVLAGTPVEDLHEALAREGQRTALPERGGTVGGALAVGDDALTAPGVGTVRASLLQCALITSDGGIATGGGPTVKNVSGYDIPRLMVGSLGTLALLGEVLLRTNPIPERSQWLRGTDVDAYTVRAALHRPSALCTDGATTWVLLEGHGVDISDERSRLSRLGAFEPCEAGPPTPDWRWSVTRVDLRRWVDDRHGDGLACLMTGRLWRHRRQPGQAVDAATQLLHARLKQEFDPSRRLNPGKNVLID